MQAEYYSDKSIAVFGDTKPWAGNLRPLGGKFNSNLRGRPGWIFSRSKEAELMQFLANANAGMVTPTAQAPMGSTAQLVPMGAAPVAMSPVDALARLQGAQAAMPTINPIVGPATTLTLTPQTGTVQPMIPQPMAPQVMAPQIIIPQPTPQPAVYQPSPAPVTPLPAQIASMTYPNLFVAADGLRYQIILYTAPLPVLGQRITLNLTGEQVSLEYTVTRIDKETPPFDTIVITKVPDPVEEGQELPEPSHSRAVLVNGVWKIHCMQNDHTLTFHPQD